MVVNSDEALRLQGMTPCEDGLVMGKVKEVLPVTVGLGYRW